MYVIFVRVYERLEKLALVGRVNEFIFLMYRCGEFFCVCPVFLSFILCLCTCIFWHKRYTDFLKNQYHIINFVQYIFILCVEAFKNNVADNITFMIV